nr:MAG TPA: hypothetical protein [Caudoviricetes sp.]DAQ49804.1 MAG TPA: hypothetical protein [Caudoviricetes sp.]
MGTPSGAMHPHCEHQCGYRLIVAHISCIGKNRRFT